MKFVLHDTNDLVTQKSYQVQAHDKKNILDLLIIFASHHISNQYLEFYGTCFHRLESQIFIGHT